MAFTSITDFKSKDQVYQETYTNRYWKSSIVLKNHDLKKKRDFVKN